MLALTVTPCQSVFSKDAESVPKGTRKITPTKDRKLELQDFLYAPLSPSWLNLAT